MNNQPKPPRMAETCAGLWRAFHVARTGVFVSGYGIGYPVAETPIGHRISIRPRDGELELLDSAHGMSARPLTRGELNQIDRLFDEDRVRIVVPKAAGHRSNYQTPEVIAVLHEPLGRFAESDEPAVEVSNG